MVVDWDALAVALGSPDRHQHPSYLKPYVRAARDAVYRSLVRCPVPGVVWVISCDPPAVHVHETVVMTTPVDVCLDRAQEAGRTAEVMSAIELWQPPREETSRVW